MYSNILLFATASFHFLVYSFNVTFSDILKYFNLFHFTTFPFHCFVFNLNVTFLLPYSFQYLCLCLCLLQSIVVCPHYYLNWRCYLLLNLFGLFYSRNIILWVRLRYTFLSFVYGNLPLFSFSIYASLCFLN